MGQIGNVILYHHDIGNGPIRNISIDEQGIIIHFKNGEIYCYIRDRQEEKSYCLIITNDR